MPDRSRPRDATLALAVLFEAGLGALAWLLGRAVGIEPGATLRAEPRAAALGVVATLPLLPIAWWGLRSGWSPLARIRAIMDELLPPLFAGCRLPELALIAAAAGVGEELLFRGLIQSWLVDRLGLAAGLVGAGVAFGALHAITPAYAMIAGLMGTYLGLVWVGTGNLLAPIVAHGLYDLLVLAYLLRLRTSRTTREARP